MGMASNMAVLLLRASVMVSLLLRTFDMVLLSCWLLGSSKPAAVTLRISFTLFQQHKRQPLSVFQILIEDVSTLLMLIKDCQEKETNKHELDCNCSNRCIGSKHKIDRYAFVNRC